jgi:hypothetical protein
MFRTLLAAASLVSLFAIDARTRAAGDPRGPRYGVGFDPLAAARGQSPSWAWTISSSSIPR